MREAYPGIRHGIGLRENSVECLPRGFGVVSPLRNQAGDWFAMTSDDDLFATLNTAEQFGEVRLRIIGADRGCRLGR